MRPLKFDYAIVTPTIDLGMRSLCVYPYPNHPKGCPNFGKKSTCPPKCERFPYVYDNRQDVWAFWAEYDLGAHRYRQKKRHPLWSPRQLVNSQHWQGTVRKFLRESIAKWMGENKDEYPDLAVTTCPEGMGVNVTATMENIGVVLEWPPKKTTRLIYLAGVLR
ncbi:hypothetical protein KAR91_20360 [Candidatus Pacearchaeota archaeon]|nr:hypothetical protein [Candidatus Pacearchaeota archaeon]